MSDASTKVLPDPVAEVRSAKVRTTSITVAHVMTKPISLHFLSGQVSFVRNRGFAVHVITSPGPNVEPFTAQEGAPVHAVEMTRRVTPVEDLRALWGVWRTLRRIRPHIVHGHTPKGGLLAMVGGWLARTPVRVYHLRGLPLATATGPRRAFLRLAERTSCLLAHRVLAVSPSLRAVMVEEGLCAPGKIKVLRGGSGNGIDAAGRFTPQPEGVRQAMRSEHGFPPDAVVVGFVGRITRDKGFADLAAAWKLLRDREPRLHLLVVGSPEREDPVPVEVLRALEAEPRARFVGSVPPREMPREYAAMDMVALPSHREGFPNVGLEGAAMALPVVATSATGCVDAVVDGVTGTIVPPRSPQALAAALARYASDPGLRAAHGQAGRRRVLAEFRPEDIWEAILAEYRSLLGENRGAARRVS